MQKPTFTALLTTIVSGIPFLSFGLFLSLIIPAPISAETQNPVCSDEATGQQNNCITITEAKNFDEDQVRVRFKATQANGRAINNLDSGNIIVKFNGQPVKLPPNAIKPAQSTPTPARVVMLLDYSGSMNAPDTKGNTKIEGSLQGIEKFLELGDKNKETSGIDWNNTKMVIVPFGIANKTQCQGNQVVDQLIGSQNPNSKAMITNFFPVDSAQIKTNIDFYRNNPPCDSTSTNLYDALATTYEVLWDQSDTDLYPTNTQTPQPRLFIILLSDGFNTEPFDNNYKNFNVVAQRCHQAHFDKLNREYLQKEKGIDLKIFTLAYGLNEEILGEPRKNGFDKVKLGLRDNEAFYADLGRDANCTDVKFTNYEKLPIPARIFVDTKSLNDIAVNTGGFLSISGDADGIIKSFAEIRDAILGEYEFIYTPPNADKGKKYQVEVTTKYQNQTLSDTDEVTMKGILNDPLPMDQSFVILLIILVIGGSIYYYFLFARD